MDEVNTPLRAIQRVTRSLVASRTPAEWSAYELTALWLTILAIGAGIFIPKVRTGCLIFAVVSFVGWALSTFALSDEVMGDRTAPPGVVVVSSAEARFAPLADSTVHFKLEEGTQIVIREDRGQWVLVERADGQQGWVTAPAISRVMPL